MTTPVHMSRPCARRRTTRPSRAWSKSSWAPSGPPKSGYAAPPSDTCYIQRVIHHASCSTRAKPARALLMDCSGSAEKVRAASLCSPTAIKIASGTLHCTASSSAPWLTQVCHGRSLPVTSCRTRSRPPISTSWPRRPSAWTPEGTFSRVLAHEYCIRWPTMKPWIFV
jgi:hypothetical protein